MVASAVRAVNGDVDFAFPPGQSTGAARTAAVSQTGAHGLFQFERGVAQFGRPGGAHEFRAAARRTARCPVSRWRRPTTECRSARRSFKSIRSASGEPG
jgi:hypothetical protein